MHAQPVAVVDMEDVHMVDIADIQTGEKNREEDWAEDENAGLCTTCVKMKIWRSIARKLVEPTKQPFKLIHSDQCGPISPPSKGGARYFILYIDDYSRLCHI
jgi:hypothetical protein